MEVAMSKLRILSCLAALLLVVAGTAWAETTSNVGGMRQDEKNESRIRELYDNFETAWNKPEKERNYRPVHTSRSTVKVGLGDSHSIGNIQAELSLLLEGNLAADPASN